MTTDATTSAVRSSCTCGLFRLCPACDLAPSEYQPEVEPDET